MQYNRSPLRQDFFHVLIFGCTKSEMFQCILCTIELFYATVSAQKYDTQYLTQTCVTFIAWDETFLFDTLCVLGVVMRDNNIREVIEMPSCVGALFPLQYKEQ